MTRKKTHKVDQRPPFECIALLLQGGGALGAYQGGVYQALHEAGLSPDWVAGISIGAINAALIAGNAPEKRVEHLRAFWEGVTVDAFGPAETAMKGDISHTLMNQVYAGMAMTQGVQGFYKPRLFSPWLQPPGTPEATSWYDTSDLRLTLEKLVDFERINAGGMRFSVGAVNVRSGNFAYFENTTHEIGPEHIMASGALPPGFPAVEIEGECYWDGGLVSNTPLDWVLNSTPQKDTLAFQVDLWSARGEMPTAMINVMTRQKEIQYSSRTRASTDAFRIEQEMRRGIADLLDELPADLKKKDGIRAMKEVASRKVYNIAHLIYHARNYEGTSKDYEFSRRSMEEHWQAGYFDTVRTLRHEEVLQHPRNGASVYTFDLAKDGRE